MRLELGAAHVPLVRWQRPATLAPVGMRTHSCSDALRGLPGLQAEILGLRARLSKPFGFSRALGSQPSDSAPTVQKRCRDRAHGAGLHVRAAREGCSCAPAEDAAGCHNELRPLPIADHVNALQDTAVGPPRQRLREMSHDLFEASTDRFRAPKIGQQAVVIRRVL